MAVMPSRILALVVLVVLVSVAPGQSMAGGRGFAGGGGGHSHGGGFKSGHGGGVRAGHAHFGGFKSTHTFVSRSAHPPVSVFPTTVDPWKFWGRKHGHHHHHGFFKHSFVAPGVVWGGGTAVYYAYAPPVAYAYAPEPVVYSPAPAAYYAAPAPMPTVVEYSTGRYELRGDGVTTAYQWVWIPKPPSGPPPEAAPESAPQSQPPAREERSIGKIYRWTDEDGVTTFTDRLENVPKRHRPRAEPKA
jgi:hypothetical protein